jgi:predicted acylesterase/phospholipase RssA
MSRLSRSTFLAAGAAAAVVSRAPATAQPAPGPAAVPTARKRVLVLSGGTAHGAYEGGVLEGLGGVRYDVVCGTSIGALNGAMFAARRGAELSALWHSLGNTVVLDLKAPYRHVTTESAGVGTRIYEAIRLANEATRGTLQAVMRTEPVLAILRDHLVVNGSVAPFVVPLFWATSNLTAGCAAYYYRNPPRSFAAEYSGAQLTVASFTGAAARAGLAAAMVPENAEQIIEALRASSAIPAVFDPSFVPVDAVGPYAGNVLVDGGIVNNTPFALVRAAAQDGPLDVDAVLLGTPTAAHTFAETRNILGILFACYDLMTQKLMDDAVRALSRDVASTNALRAAREQMNGMMTELADPRIAGSPLARSARLEALRAAVAQTDTVLAQSVQNDVRIRFRSPSAPLVGSSFAFQDQGALTANYALGLKDIDGGNGWQPYSIPADLCKLTGELVK